jgi:hypothetical protein
MFLVIFLGLKNNNLICEIKRLSYNIIGLYPIHLNTILWKKSVKE